METVCSYCKIFNRFQVVHGGSIYQSLRIPDTGGRGFEVLDALLLTERWEASPDLWLIVEWIWILYVETNDSACRELYVFSIQTLSGTVKIRDDGTWLETDLNGNAIVHPNMVSHMYFFSVYWFSDLDTWTQEE